VTAKPGVLYVVSTPIGNLGDITLRAIETLRACDRIAAEDTRRTRELLSHLGISGKPLDAIHGHSSEHAVARVVERLTLNESVALVTDAGTPVVSDPGALLVERAVAAGVTVVPVPGVSAVLAALVASGVAGQGRFRFVGFLPRDGVPRADAVAEIAATPETVVLFEAPLRTNATLRDLSAATPDRAACVARELTKLHEELVRGRLEDLAWDAREWRGEVVIVLGPHEPPSPATIDDGALEARIDAGLAAGIHAKALAAELAAWSGRPRRDVYAHIVSRKR
jgi:16S rRNA (cytidine1402-2'-O)-methyltransferase